MLQTGPLIDCPHLSASPAAAPRGSAGLSVGDARRGAARRVAVGRGGSRRDSPRHDSPRFASLRFVQALSNLSLKSLLSDSDRSEVLSQITEVSKAERSGAGRGHAKQSVA